MTTIMNVADLCGWGVWSDDNKTFMEDETRDLVNGLYAAWQDSSKDDHRMFGDLQIVGAGPPVRTMLWEAARRVLGKDVPNIPQEIGDCVGVGSKHAIEYVQFYPIINGERSTWTSVFSPYLYGCGRVFIGKGQLTGDGSMGAWQALAVMQYGTLAEDSKAGDGTSLPGYSGAVARKWGAPPGPATKWVDVGKQHLVKSAAFVGSWDKAVEAVNNGYPLTIASNVGFDMLPQADGYHHYTANWGHNMCLIGVDPGGDGIEPHGCIMNSWGDVHGKVIDFRTREQWPVGTLRVRKGDIQDILDAKDSYAYSSLVGFPAQSIPKELFSPW